MADSAVLRPRADVGEDGVEGAEHWLRGEQPLLVTEQADPPVHERLLRVELVGGDGDRRVPGLLHAHVLGVGGACAEAGLPVGDLEVVGDVAFRTRRDDLGEADLVLGGQAAERIVAVDDAAELGEPVEAQIADGRQARSLPGVTVRRSDEVDTTDDRPHPGAAVEEWVFTAWLPGGGAGLITGYRRPAVGPGWYWSALARPDAPLLHVAEWHVPPRSDALLVKAHGLWAEHVCERPLEQWTVANETFADALEDPDDAVGRGYG